MGAFSIKPLPRPESERYPQFGRPQPGTGRTVVGQPQPGALPQGRPPTSRPTAPPPSPYSGVAASQSAVPEIVPAGSLYAGAPPSAPQPSPPSGAGASPGAALMSGLGKPGPTQPPTTAPPSPPGFVGTSVEVPTYQQRFDPLTGQWSTASQPGNVPSQFGTPSPVTPPPPTVPGFGGFSVSDLFRRR